MRTVPRVRRAMRERRRPGSIASTAALALALVACGAAPVVSPPPAVLPVPAALPAAVEARGTAVEVIDAEFEWRAVIVDARLRRLVDIALEHNRDLRIAALAIEAARARHRIVDAQRGPTVEAAAGAGASRSAADLRGAGQDAVSRAASVTVGVTAWELDLWGRIASLREAALASFLATEQAQRAVRASLIAEVAAAWFTLAADLQYRELAEQTLQTRRRSLELAERRKSVGTVSALDVAAAQSALAAARDERAAADAQLALDRNTLRLLLGADVPAELEPSPSEGAAGLALVGVPAGLSSTVLLRRPDVRAAEQALHAAQASVAAARAALFPTIALTATAGTASDALAGLFGAGNGTWTLAPGLRWPVFDGGAARAGVALAEVERAARVAAYERTVQAAFKEVADALAQRAVLAERLAAQAALVTASEATLRLAGDRHRAGSESALALLDAQRTLFAAQQRLLALELAERTNRLALFKALGGS